MHAHSPHWHFLIMFYGTSASEMYTLSLHDALPIWIGSANVEYTTCLAWHTAAVKTLADAMSKELVVASANVFTAAVRSEEHTSELQSRVDLVCRLLLEKNKNLR